MSPPRGQRLPQLARFLVPAPCQVFRANELPSVICPVEGLAFIGHMLWGRISALLKGRAQQSAPGLAP